ncbi:hypothetical protein GCM10007906_35290 [Vibrio hyugaensis]|uniref:Uncharacterized protein n=1 Tax=Vibrio hyugaensis TaxID=1534743 RepID=A0ABQ5Y4U4_9VIBR|nr:hypothetical protein [Vibrio hyugaensis]GLR05941.1 hypothetical protein GCM10007906_35290 [Vibrio hyugaensis]
MTIRLLGKKLMVKNPVLASCHDSVTESELELAHEDQTPKIKKGEPLGSPLLLKEIC